jgi:hypothetical protein
MDTAYILVYSSCAIILHLVNVILCSSNGIWFSSRSGELNVCVDGPKRNSSWSPFYIACNYKCMEDYFIFVTVTVEPRLSELRLTETRINRNAYQALRFQNCLPRDSSEPLPVSLLRKVDVCGRVANWRVCASYSAVLTFHLTVIANSVG